MHVMIKIQRAARHGCVGCAAADAPQVHIAWQDLRLWSHLSVHEVHHFVELAYPGYICLKIDFILILESGDSPKAQHSHGVGPWGLSDREALSNT